MKQKIVFKIRSFPNISETFVVQSIIAAMEQGYDIRIITDKVNRISESSQPELISKYDLMQKVTLYEEPSTKKVRLLRAIGILLNPQMIYYFLRYCRYKKKKTLSYLFQLAFYRKYRKAGTFHVHFADNIYPLAALKKIGFIQSKLIVTFHGYDAHYFPARDSKNDQFAEFEEAVDHMAVNSNYLKSVLVRKGFNSNDINVIPVGLDTALFSKENTIVGGDETFKLVTIGRLIPLKGQEQGIRAVKLLVDNGYTVHYTIIGDGPSRGSLETLIKELHLEQVVSMAGEKQQPEIIEYLSSQQLFLMTSTKDKHGRREAFGLVSLEAQAMGIPVVGFNSGGFPETIIEGKTGFSVAEGDILALTKAITTLIDDPEMLSKMSTNAIRHVRTHLDHEITAKRYFDLYQI